MRKLGSGLFSRSGWALGRKIDDVKDGRTA
jgi:hypothetical protein